MIGLSLKLLDIYFFKIHLHLFKKKLLLSFRNNSYTYTCNAFCIFLRSDFT